MLNVALWVVQGLLAGVFLLTGTTKLVLPREVLEKRMHWAAAWPRWRIKLLGLAEVAGAGGLVVPGAMGVAPVLTAIAALCLAVLMVGAVGTHRRLGESAVPAVVIGALCLVVGAAHLQTGPAHAHPEGQRRRAPAGHHREPRLQAAETITELSTFSDLSPGDVLLTGTPAGCALRAPSPLVRQLMQLVLPGPKLWATFTRVQARGPQYLRPGGAVRGTIASADGVIDLGEPRHVVEGPTA